MITFCIPSKNNLRYLKTCIASIQENSHFDNEVLVYVDQDNDGTEEWLQKNSIPYILNTDKECKGIGHAYDTMFRESKTDLVVAFHADMILGPNADLHLTKHHTRGTVVCSTRIEPPLHPPGPEKVVMDFGMWPEDIKWDEFNTFVEKLTKENENKITKSSFAPWLINRNDHLGHDPIFLSVYEDADLFRRFKLANYDIKQVWSSLVYHLTCRGGQFEHAKTNNDFQYKSQQWQHNNQLSLLEYIRKWGGMFKEYGPCEPRPNIKYNIGVKIVNSDPRLLSFEPFFDQLQVDCDIAQYIQNEQPNTSFDLQKKFVQELSTDVIVEFNPAVGNIQEFQYIVNNIEEIMDNVEDDSVYEFGTIKIIVNKKRNVPIKLKMF